VGGGLLLTFILSCQKATIQQADEKLPSISILDRTTFSSTIPTSKWNDMLVFNSWADFDKTLDDISSSTSPQVDSWENTLAFLSQRRIFRQVEAAEDSINTYYKGLPAFQQAYYASQPEPFSNQLTYWLQKGVIKNVTDASDNSVYWDYNLINEGVAPLVNEKGLVKVGGKIVQFTQGNLVKVILDGDFAKVANLPNLTTPIKTTDYWVYNAKPESVPEACFGNNWSKTNSWVSFAPDVFGNNQKRVKVELSGSSSAYIFGPAVSGCTGIPFGTLCTNQIKTMAQKKNFWGVFKYTSEFSPALSIVDATWTNSVSLFKDGCFGPAFNFTNIDTPWPKPLWNKSVPLTNKGVFPFNPHTSGWLEFYHPPIFADVYYIECTVNLPTFNIPCTYAGFGPSSWNIVR
jgi:hypothetical protein